MGPGLHVSPFSYMVPYPYMGPGLYVDPGLYLGPGRHMGMGPCMGPCPFIGPGKSMAPSRVWAHAHVSAEGRHRPGRVVESCMLMIDTVILTGVMSDMKMLIMIDCIIGGGANQQAAVGVQVLAILHLISICVWHAVL